MKKVFNITESFLIEEYSRNNKSITEISKELGCSIALVSKYIKKYQLKKLTEKKYIGEKFGKLTTLKKIGYDKNSHIIFDCRCECGKTIQVISTSLISGNTTSCGCSSRQMGKNHKNYSGYEEIRGVMWNWLKKGAKIRGLCFDISIEYVWDLYIKQDKKCALSGIPIYFTEKRKNLKYSTASLDRIDSTKGYIEGNVQWVHKQINKFKMNMQENELIYWCILIADRYKGKTQ